MAGRFSPWAERFREVVDSAHGRPPILTEKDGTEHSGIAILYPHKGPKFYNDPFREGVYQEEPQDAIELDRFCTNEQQQKRELIGAETWQLATLNRYLYVSSQLPLFPGGHQAADDPTRFFQAFATNRMAANPDEWFNFLHKNRWYDLVSVSDSDGTPDNGPMSVDNPPVWDNLRGSIDLVDRLLKALIVDRHNGFEGMLYGRIFRWEEVAHYTQITSPHRTATVLFTPEMEEKIGGMEQKTPYRNELYGLTEEQRITAMAQRLANLLQLHTWSFAPMGMDSGFTTNAHPEVNWSTLTAVNKSQVQRLLGDDITLAERFIIQFDLTITMIHELMHAIISCRIKELGMPINLPEPFIDFDPISEVGEAMEKRLFGGRYILTPVVGLPLATVLCEWPRDGTSGMINHRDPIWRSKIEEVRQPFPVLFISKLFSAQFWDNIYAPGKAAMRFWQSEIFKNFELDKTNEDNWDREEHAIAEAYQDAWYEREYYRTGRLRKHMEIWGLTAWGICNWKLLTRFANNFQKNEVECAIACVETRYFDCHSVKNFMERFPKANGTTAFWVPFCIGLLMYAAMPVRKSEYSMPNPRLKEVQAITFKPSTECEVLRKYDKPALPEKVEMRPTHRTDWDMLSRPKNSLFNPLLSDTDTVVEEESATQMKYLSFLADILNLIKEERAVVSLRWIREIERCAKDLEAQRLDIIATYPSTHLSRWAKEWNFVAPDFSTSFMEDIVRWDNTTQEFIKCPLEVLTSESETNPPAPTTPASTTSGSTTSTSTSSASLPGGFPEDHPSPPEHTEPSQGCTIM